MPIVNYVQENEAFIEYAADNGLTANEILVWHALFHIMNQRANGKYWPDGFIRIKNDRVLLYSTIKFDAMARARNSLAQRGLIAFKPGKKNADIPMYEMHYLTAAQSPILHDADEDAVENPVHNSPATPFYPFSADRTAIKPRQNRDKTEVKPLQNRDQYINLNQNESHPNESGYAQEEDEEAQPLTRAREGGTPETDNAPSGQRAAMGQAIRDGMRAAYGRAANPAEVGSIASAAMLYDVSPEMIRLALRLAAEAHAEQPAGYLRSIFQQWSEEAVTTPEEYDEYAAYEAILRRGDNTLTGSKAADLAQAAYLERRKKHPLFPRRASRGEA